MKHDLHQKKIINKVKMKNNNKHRIKATMKKRTGKKEKTKRTIKLNIYG